MKCKHVEVGGIDCPCCRPLPSKTKSKKWLNRLFRRTFKQKRMKYVSDVSDVSDASDTSDASDVSGE